MTRSLQALRVGNFKAFADTQRIPLKPITLIFGPNSAGKSSFIHSLALAHEAQFGREKRSLSRLDVHHTDVGGSSIDLGGFRQYVHRGQLNKRVEWGAELRVAALASGKYQRLAQLLAPVSNVALNIALGIELDDQDRPKPGAEPRVDSVEITGDGVELLRMSRRLVNARADVHTVHLRLDRLASDHAVFRQVFNAIVEAQTTSEEMRSEDFDVVNEAIAALLPELVVYVDQFFPSSVELTKADGYDISPVSMLFPVSKGNSREDIAQAVRFALPSTLNDLIKGLADALADEIRQLQYLGPLRSFPPRHLAFAEHEDANWYAGGGYAWDVVRRDDTVREAVNDWLGSGKLKTPYKLVVETLLSETGLFDSIRTGLEAPQNGSIDFATMQSLILGSATEVDSAWKKLNEREDINTGLLNYFLESGFLFEDGYPPYFEPDDSPDVKARVIEYAVNRWNTQTFMDRHKESFELLGDEEMLDMERAETAERIVQVIQKNDSARYQELALVDLRTHTQVTHRDVGIGISQVLPVLVMAYASRGKLIAMEQPEIHLHPALQAELGDVFIEAALGERKNTFILETHSEHLILRLMRRIREGKISPDDIGVIFVEPLARGSRFIELNIDEEGDFIDEWPGGFFEESFHEKFGGD
jgi:hypothetical protein